MAGKDPKKPSKSIQDLEKEIAESLRKSILKEIKVVIQRLETTLQSSKDATSQFSSAIKDLPSMDSDALNGTLDEKCREVWSKFSIR